MRIDQILEKLKADLSAWTTQRRGRMSIATDPWNALELLVQGPQGFQVILHWAGDDAEGDQPQEPLGNQILEVTIGYNIGLRLPLGDALIKTTNERSSLLKFVDDLRARLLTYVFPEDETSQYLAYGGTKPVTLPDGIPLAAYKITTRLMAKVETDEVYRGSV